MSASKKSVSFGEHVFVSEYDQETVDFDGKDFNQQPHPSHLDRFSVEHIQGIPFKPRRPSSRDEALLQPIRQASLFEVSAEPPSDSMWSTAPIQRKPKQPRRQTLEDTKLMQPTRQSSQYADDSERICGDEGESSNEGPPQIPQRPASPERRAHMDKLEAKSLSRPRTPEVPVQGPMRLPQRLESTAEPPEPFAVVPTLELIHPTSPYYTGQSVQDPIRILRMSDSTTDNREPRQPDHAAELHPIPELDPASPSRIAKRHVQGPCLASLQPST